jgi:hypothetical protein
MIWSSNRLIVQEGLRRCCAVWLGNLFPKFRTNVPPSSLGLWDNTGTQNTDYKGGTFSKHREALTQQHGRPGSSARNKFAYNVFQLSVMSSLSSLLHKRRRSMAVLSSYYLKWGCGEQTTLPYLSLSLTHTNTFFKRQGMAGNMPHP